MTGTIRPACELSFNELQAADIQFAYDEGAGQYLYRDSITGREIEPGELIPVPGPGACCEELEPEWDDADSAAYQARVEAGLELEAGP